MRAARPRASPDLSRSFSTGVWSFELLPRPARARRPARPVRAAAGPRPPSRARRGPAPRRAARDAAAPAWAGRGAASRGPQRGCSARSALSGPARARRWFLDRAAWLPLPQAARRSNRRSDSAGVVHERAATLGRELLERLPGELARLHVPVLPPAHGGEGDAQGLCQSFLGEPDAPAPGADDAPRLARWATHLPFAVSEHEFPSKDGSNPGATAQRPPRRHIRAAGASPKCLT